jgi:restriction system protein
MADITRKRTGELIQRLFSILSEAPDGLPGRDALDRTLPGLGHKVLE